MIFQKHPKYLSYVLRHKWFVFVECCRHGLFWRGLVHDLSKFLPDEWFPYAEFFYGKGQGDRPGYYHEPGTQEEFDTAWLRHISRNPHHWQFWILQEDEGNAKILPMSEQYLKEMICDWKGAARAQGKDPVKDLPVWYEGHKHKMKLNPETRKQVERYLRDQETTNE